jgi:hypothetical protein
MPALALLATRKRKASGTALFLPTDVVQAGEVAACIGQVVKT